MCFHIIGIIYARCVKYTMENFLKQLQRLFLILLISYLPLSAQKLYIKVMSVSHSDFLFSAEYDIHELGYKMYYSKKEKLYRVYVGVFNNREEATKALVRIRKYINKNAFIVGLEIKNNDVIAEKLVEPVIFKAPPKIRQKKPSKVVKKKIIVEPIVVTTAPALTMDIIEPTEQVQKVATISELNEPKEKSDEAEDTFFIGLNAGFSKMGLNEQTISGSVPLSVTLEDSALNLGAEFGYCFNKHIFTTIN